MKLYKLFLFTFAILAICSCMLSAQDVDNLKYGKLNEMKIPDVEKITLDNGIQLYLLEDKELPIFRVSVRMNCGSFLEPADKTGLASICGDVMRTGGTSKWSGDEIDEKLEAVGGSVETFIGLESGGASVNVLSDYTDLGLEVLAEVLRNPKFEEDKIELAKVQERSSISRRNDDPQAIAFREFRKVIYGADSPYAAQTEYATIDAITRDDLIAFHKKWYKPQNMQLAIWGDIDKKEIIEKVNKYFGDWKKEGDPVPALPEVDYKFESKVYYVNKPDVNQTNILIGHVGGKVTDPDYGTLIVMNNIFGGGFGSRLFNNVRSKEGLAYAVFGSYTANIKYPGIFVGFASTKSETTGKAIKKIIEEMNRMQTDAPTADEMKMGKDGYLNSFVFNFDSKSEVINRLMNYDFYGLPSDHLFKVKNDVEKVTPADVVKAAQNNLRTDALRVVVVGKGEDFEIPLDQLGLGEVVEVDITIPSGETSDELTINDETLAQGKALLAKAVEFAGGQGTVNNVNSIAQKGQFLMNTPQGEMALNFETLWEAPHKSRQVMSIMGTQMFSVRDGVTGWNKGMAGEKQMTEEELLKANKDDLRRIIMILKNADNSDFKAVYAGDGKVNNTEVSYVAIFNQADEQLCKVGIGADGALICKEYWGETALGEGNVQEVFTETGEYSGLRIPTNYVQNLNDSKVGSFNISEVVVNGDVPADAFAKPE